ncbi:chemotaxis protein CheW [Clostridium beijerinckii]|uniref:chemotaxis protein CheW n=1 Tax=Clostridium beijerinckii TaxID=1520 RepID=UPI00080A76A6|nr:chemotaxis protein CheW [Clostridium beijerinckii]OCA97195.1 hypothetical protein BGS1_05455 [Clostridium beijerinckii]
MPRGKVNKELINSIDKIKLEINQKRQRAKEIHKSNGLITEKDNLSNNNLELSKSENNNKTISKVSKGKENINEEIRSTSKVMEVANKAPKSTSKRNKSVRKKHKSKDEKNKVISEENKNVSNVIEIIDKSKVYETINKDKYVVFMLNNEEYAIELVNVKEIIRVPEVKKVPNSMYIEGLCNLRGELVTIIDIHKRYNISQSECSDNSRVIVMEFNGCIVGIIVDKVSQVLDVEKAAIKLIHENSNDTKEGCIDGVIMLENGKRLIMIMDAQSIVNINGLGGSLTNVHKQEHQKISVFATENNEESIQLIIFSINSVEYAFYISEIKEIIRIPKIAKPPNVSSFIEGVISLRNELIGVINLSKIINMNSESINENGSILIVDIGTLTYGVIVDKVSEVKLIYKKDLLKPSQVVGNIDVKIVKEFGNIDNGKRVVTVLDTNNLIDLKELQCNLKVDKKEDVSNNPNKDLLVSKKTTESIVIFKIENEEYGIRINSVEEINIISKITGFPNEENFVEGLVNLRGDMIPIINIRRFFGLDSQYNDSNCKILIVRIKNKKAGIRIDSASEVLSFSEDIFQKYPDGLNSENNKRCIDGMIKLNDGSRIVLSLNLDAVFNFM